MYLKIYIFIPFFEGENLKNKENIYIILGEVRKKNDVID